MERPLCFDFKVFQKTCCMLDNIELYIVCFTEHRDREVGELLQKEGRTSGREGQDHSQHLEETGGC